MASRKIQGKALSLCTSELFSPLLLPSQSYVSHISHLSGQCDSTYALILVRKDFTFLSSLLGEYIDFNRKGFGISKSGRHILEINYREVCIL